MKARDVMTPEPVAVGPDTDVLEIARILLERRISGVPVVDEQGRVLGIVSEGDLVRRLEDRPDEGRPKRRSWWLELLTLPEDRARRFVRAHGRTARDVMTPNPVTVRPDTPLSEIARILEERHIKRVPVVDEQGRLVGIVSRADLLRALAARPPEPTAASDAELRRRVLEAFDAAGLVHYPYVNVVVSDGVVHLWGLVSSREEAKALELAASEVPGVKRVENHLAVKPAVPEI